MVVILDCDCYILTSNDHVTIQCITDSDCPLHLACGDDGECVHPPCPDCEANANCEGRNHTGICTCISGYVRDPYLEGCNFSVYVMYLKFSAL